VARPRRRLDGKWLRKELIRAFIDAGEPIEGVAADCEVTRATLSRYLNEHNDMRGENIAKVIDALGLRDAVTKALRGK
jgi:DNA-binding phage protein